jgi:hypothetical protein
VEQVLLALRQERTLDADLRPGPYRTFTIREPSVADRIKFFLDEHVLKAVREGLRRGGVDAITVEELGLQQKTRGTLSEQLKKAAWW